MQALWDYRTLTHSHSLATKIIHIHINTVWLLIFEGDLFSLFSRVLHDLRKLKKYQNFDPKNADSAMAKFSS